MVKPVSDHEQPDFEAYQHLGVEEDAPLSDDALLDLLDALVDEHTRVPAARVLEVNYRILAICCDSRQVSRRMRLALVEFRDRGDDDGGETEDVDGDAPPHWIKSREFTLRVSFLN